MKLIPYDKLVNLEGIIPTNVLISHINPPLTMRANIADIDTSAIDNTWGQQENDVLTDLRTKFNTLLDELEALRFLRGS